MKSLILLFVTTTLIFASEFVSIQPTNLVADYQNKGTVLIYDQLVPLTKDSKNPKALGSTGFTQEDWYVDNGWNEYKAYYPPGTGLSNIQFIARTNSTYRIHLAFKVDDTATVNHVNPDHGTTYLGTKNTTEFLATNGKNITIDSDMINNSNGGWLYIFMVEDAANVESYYGDVNPNILLTTATIITDTTKFNEWKNTVDLSADGSPGDAIGVLNVIEKISPTSSSSRQIAMDLAVDPNQDKDGDGVSPAQGDCNDYNSAIYPGAEEIANDGIDQDCNNADLVNLGILDQDGDSYTPNSGDCDDSNPQINPGQTPIPYNGINDNCAQAVVYEYTSLHPSDLLTDLDEKFKNSNAVVINKNINVSKQLSEESGEWYAPNGWQSYKFFIPKGLDTARIVATSTTQDADFKIHAAFKANHNQTITHVNPVQVSNLINNKETVEATSVNGAIELEYDTDFINNENGGYAYLDIANNPLGVAADVSMQLILQMQDHSVFDAWKYNVNVVYDDLAEDGNPEDSVLNMTIIDKLSITSTPSRYVPMQRSLLTWSEYTDTQAASSSSSSLASSSSSSSGIDCRSYVNWNNPQCTGSVTSNPTSVSSSSSSSYSSSSSSTGNSDDIDCRVYANWNNPVCKQGDKSGDEEEESSQTVELSTDISVIKEALSGKEIVLSGTFSEYDFDHNGKMDPFDWVYKDSFGYAQLRGKPATDTNVFGWKDVSINERLVSNWYMFALDGDVDGDGSTKFDWMIISADDENKQVYKLSGVTDRGTFRYSELIDIDYEFSGDRLNVVFSPLRPGERTNQ